MSLGFTELDWKNDNNSPPINNGTNSGTNKVTNFKKTLKKRPPLKKLLNNLGENPESSESDGNTLDDYKGALASTEAFTPPPHPALSKIKQLTDMKNGILDSEHDKAIDTEDYEQLNGQQLANDEFYKKYVPYYTQQSNGPQLEMNDNILLQKMNQMIHLLEEQKDEKTNNVTEELILYCFLGVFVIFVVDSFSKTGGKYTR
jgi:hypothetical protein